MRGGERETRLPVLKWCLFYRQVPPVLAVCTARKHLLKLKTAKGRVGVGYEHFLLQYLIALISHTTTMSLWFCDGYDCSYSVVYTVFHKN